MEVEDQKAKAKRNRDSSSSSSDYEEEPKQEWQEVTLAEFEMKHGKYEETEVEFEVKVIEDFDYKTINSYLTHLLNNKSFDSRQLTEIILKQEYLGSCIRQADDDDCFGFISAVALNSHKTDLWHVQLQNYITSNAPPQDKNHWSELVRAERVGLLLSERLVNIPHALAPGLHQTIFEEIQWAVEDGNPFQFDHLIYITMYGHDDPEGLVLGKKKKKIKKDAEAQLNWFKVEDYIYLKHSVANFKKAINHSETKLVMHISMASIPAILKEINEYIAENYCW